jgi:methyl-accepting chemotaxis protein
MRDPARLRPRMKNIKIPRFSDIPLVVKIALAPAFALVILAFIAASTVWSQQRQTAVLASVIDDGRVQNALATDAQDLTAANGALYVLMSKRADGDSLANGQQALKHVLDLIAQVKANLTELGPSVPASFRGVSKDLIVYQGAVEIVGSLLGVNFHTAAAFIAPFEKYYVRMTTALNQASLQVAMASSQKAENSTRTAHFVSQTMIILVTATFLAVALVTWIIVLAVRNGVNNICQATESLAAGDHDIDLQRLQRHRSATVAAARRIRCDRALADGLSRKPVADQGAAYPAGGNGGRKGGLQDQPGTSYPHDRRAQRNQRRDFTCRHPGEAV